MPCYWNTVISAINNVHVIQIQHNALVTKLSATLAHFLLFPQLYYYSPTLPNFPHFWFTWKVYQRRWNKHKPCSWESERARHQRLSRSEMLMTSDELHPVWMILQHKKECIFNASQNFIHLWLTQRSMLRCCILEIIQASIKPKYCQWDSG